LDLFEVAELDKSDFLERYGDPKALNDVGQWAFESEKRRSCLGMYTEDAHYRDDD